MRAETALTGAQALLDGIWGWLATRCWDKGRLSAGRLDEHQLVSYEGALSAAEVAAARFMIDYAREVQREQPARSTVETDLALVSTAEAITHLQARLLARPADYGLDAATVLGALGSDAQAFCHEVLAAQALARVGANVAALEGRTGLSLLDEDHAMMRDTFRQFANDVVMPRAEDIHRQDLTLPDDLIDQLKELGCFGISIPERYGGFQPDEAEDTLSMCVVTEELSRGSLGAAGSLITRPEILARALMAGGTDEQKNHWLPKLAAGDPLCAVGVTEPDYGSDVAAMRFKATRAPSGGWLLNGTKSWLTFAGKAGVLLILARTDADSSKGHRGLSVFLVEKPAFDGHDFEHVQEQGGTISGRSIATIGYRGMHSYECFFDNYVVPDEALLGGDAGLGRGFYTIMAGFAGGRIQTAARAVGVMQAAFERAVIYAGERKVFGLPIAETQLTQIKLATMAAALASVRRFTYGVARLMDVGEGSVEASMVKLHAGRAAEYLTREAMQIHGGMGYAEETSVSRYFVDARVLSIFEGAEEILALKVIARSLVERAGKAA
ncbi:MAG: acyl-CoA dehydrogenase family protein [Deltaproteobacteria bacterium]|nr:acyl-CoA dehydrogenase family protein [Deltaproteobacteria bacterium]